MEDNKRSETDPEDTLAMSEDEFEKEFTDEQESDGGDENVTGSDDAKESEPSTFLTKEELEKIVGREIKSKDDFFNHYQNLKSYVGKKPEDFTQTDIEKITKEVQPKKSNQNSEIMDKLERIEFLGDNPDAKEYFNELIKPMADGQGLSLNEAYQKVKPYIEATKNQEKEKNIGVESKNRIEPARDKKLMALAQKARQGDIKAQDEYIRKSVLSKFGFDKE
ncbi:MAG: hypothetical protein WCR65_01330 [Parcubacteria group bacterium]|jgi:hypothetical protein